MKVSKNIQRVLFTIINLISLISAVYVFFIVEFDSKESTLNEFALGLAPSVWGFDEETPSIFLNDYIVREDHSEITITQNDDSIFCDIKNNSVKANIFMPEIIISAEIFFKDEFIGKIESKYPTKVIFPGIVFFVFQLMVNVLVILIRNLQRRNRRLSLTLKKLKKTNLVLDNTQTKLEVNNLVIGLSHEINTPLGIIVTSTSYLDNLIKENDLNPECFGNGIGLINNSLYKIQNIMDRIQQIKIEDTMLELSEFDLKNLIQMYFETKKQIYINKITKLNWIGGDRLVINSKEKVWETIVDEIIDNAFLYSKDDSELTVEYELNKDDYLKIKFMTYGIDIPEESVQSIFHPFFTTLRSETHHVGLGLHLICSLVEKVLNGRFYLEKANNPVTFTIEIPYKEYPLSS